MCFSSEVDTNIKQLAKRFQASISRPAFMALDHLMDMQAGADGPEKIKHIFNLKRKSKQFLHMPDSHGRIYPNYFAPVIVKGKNNKRTILPMRYRIRPSGSKEEIPSKYNVFNARLDALKTRKTWKNLFMKFHGLFPFYAFYEWVENVQGKKVLVKFSPSKSKDFEMMWAPCLFDVWKSPENNIEMYSFALITDEPPQEIKAVGHDRCPLFLKKEKIDEWLSPQEKSEEEIYSLLKEKERTYYRHEFVEN